MTLIETLDLHPRVAHHLNMRGLLWINEWRYPSVEDAPGGSIDFVAVDPRNGQFSIIECKIAIESVSAIERQLDRYFEAFCVSEAKKEVYAFFATPQQIQKLQAKGIDVHLVTMEILPISLETTWRVYEDIETIFWYWHGPFMLPYITAYDPNPFLTETKEWQMSYYYAGRADFYRKQLEQGDVTPYLEHIKPVSDAAFYGDAE